MAVQTPLRNRPLKARMVDMARRPKGQAPKSSAA
jgi:hypothetical protein